MKELGTGFVVAAVAAGEVGFGLDEVTFNGGFEDGGSVAFEVGLDALEAGDGFVEMGELLFDFGDDARLLIDRCNWDRKIPNALQAKVRCSNALDVVLCLVSNGWCLKKIENVLRQ